LLTKQAFSCFAPLFERREYVLNNFDTFLAVFAEAFEDHDKARSTTTKICVLQQGAHLASVYASNFRLLKCDINWDEEELMRQFHWELRDNVKDLLLSMLDPQTLNEAINQAVKCDNWLFQRRQDQHSWNSPKYSYSHSIISTTVSSLHFGTEDMQIDALRYKPFTAQKKKLRFNRGLCLYCGESSHKIDNCRNKQHCHTFKMRSATISSNSQPENGEAQPQ
jgi:hypothetical protein